MAIGPVSLIVASLDLQLVKLLRGAMSGGAHPHGPLGTTPPPRIAPRPVFEPEPRFLPRKVHEPEPHFLPRPIIQPTPRVEPLPPPPCEPWSCDAPRKTSPVQPPWKTLPHHLPPPPPPIEVKQILYQPDIPHKGSLIDFFI